MLPPALQSLLPDSASIDRGHLCVGGCDVTELAAVYGTPLYIYDESTLQQQAARALAAFGSSRVSFAAKACSIVGVLRILEAQGVGLDVVSEGEIEAGLRAGFPPHRMHLHGNAKADAELRRAVELGFHAIVLDNREELDRLETVCKQSGREARVMVRLDPPIEVETHPSLHTSGARSKFGFLWDSAELWHALDRLRCHPALRVVGLHLHLGSQIADPDVYRRAALMLRDLARSLPMNVFPLEEMSLGGGWATPYRAGDPCLSPDQVAAVLPGAEGLRWSVEPGRALVARAAVAVYRVGAVKLRDGRQMVAVDGGMGDNPRPALYGARYSAVAPGHMDAPHSHPAQVVGRYCESGDVLVEETLLPDLRAGDLLAIPVSGAYHLSMAGAYNLVPLPPAVLVDGDHRQLTRRGTLADLLAREL